ncbi:MAG: hypothetical protein LBQ95_02290 [Lachnospiraceae bacterium]|jgi:hypothetical protein|nr:hypothetical protein [Lachnospiraceae bacterium]
MENNIEICFTIATCLFCIGLLTAFLNKKIPYAVRLVVKPLYVMMIAVFLGLTVLHYPMVLAQFSGFELKHFSGILIAAQCTLQAFTINADFGNMNDFLSSYSGVFATSYHALAAILYIAAPLLTAGFLLQFVKNLGSYARYWMGYHKSVFVFSELNNRSIELAQSEKENCKRTNKKYLIVFTDVYESNDEPSAELIEKAKRLDAIVFRKDILAVNLAFHSNNNKHRLSFFVIGEDETENMQHAIGLYEKYKERENAALFLFSNSVTSSMLMNGKEGKIKLRRIDKTQSLIYHTLYEYGPKIFDKAFAASKMYNPESDIHDLNVIILGLGHYGCEMLKALVWFAQMDGYELNIYAYADYDAKEYIEKECPELFDKHNKTRIKGDAYYGININPEYDNEKKEFFDSQPFDVGTNRFLESVMHVENPTYIFISLGDDEKNISAAVDLKTNFERIGCDPIIHAVVYDTKMLKSVTTAKNLGKRPFGITCVGDLKTQYSHEVIMKSDLEKAAKERHMRWTRREDFDSDEAYEKRKLKDEDAFIRYEYYYRSSMAGAIHKKMRVHCKIAGAEKAPELRDENEKRICRHLEKRRWNAFVRTEGYVYSGSTNDASRNDLAKKHNLLVPWDELPESEKCNDDD